MDTVANRRNIRTQYIIGRLLGFVLSTISLPLFAQTPPGRTEWQARVTGVFTPISGDLARFDSKRPKAQAAGSGSLAP